MDSNRSKGRSEPAGQANDPSGAKGTAAGHELVEGSESSRTDLAEEREVMRLRRRVTELETLLRRSRRRSNTLREINTLLTSLIESTDDFIMIANARGEALFFNTAYSAVIEALTGEPARPGEKPHERLESPEARAFWERVHERALSGEKFRVNYVHLLPTGEPRHFEVSVNPILADGQIIGFAEFTREMTEHVRAAEERQELREQLLQAQKMEALGKLAGGMAHDFNNLLAVVLGNAELIAEHVDSERLRTQANKIVRVARRARDLTTKLLAFARRERLETQQISLGRLHEDVLEIVRGSVPRTIAVEEAIEDPDASLEVSLGQVSVALFNIAINAVDAMAGEGTLRVSARPEFLQPEDPRLRDDLTPGPYCCISISDTGGGMDEQTRLRATEPFFTRKEDGSGTGLGLSVSLDVVKAHGGFLEIESEVGQGTEVRVYLPRSTAPRLRPQAASPGVGQTEVALRVLVVDDEEEFRGTLAEELRCLGNDVVTASGGTEALLWLRDHPGQADMVLLDLLMPGLSGRDTYRALREIDPEVPVILCSGYSQPGEVSELLEAGASGHLQKPFDMKVLSRAIRQALSGE